MSESLIEYGRRLEEIHRNTEAGRRAREWIVPPFLVASGTPERRHKGIVYRVDVSLDGTRAVCNCPAGDREQVCYHVTGVLSGLLKGAFHDMTQQEREAVGTRAVAVRGVETNLRPIEVRPPRPEERIPSESQYDMILKIAGNAIEAARGVEAKDRMIPVGINTPAQAAAIMLAGHEIGLPPMTSLRHLFIVNGRVQMGAEVMMGLVRANDPSAEFVFHEYEREAVDVELRRGGRMVHRCRYTFDDAVASGQAPARGERRRKVATWKKVNGRSVPDTYVKDADGKDVYEVIDSVWHKYTRDMCAWASVKRVCRLGAPDLTNQIAVYDIGKGARLPAYDYVQDPAVLAVGDRGDVDPVIQALATGELVDTETGEIVSLDDSVTESDAPGTAQEGQETAEPPDPVGSTDDEGPGGAAASVGSDAKESEDEVPADDGDPGPPGPDGPATEPTREAIEQMTRDAAAAIEEREAAARAAVPPVAEADVGVQLVYSCGHIWKDGRILIKREAGPRREVQIDCPLKH